MGKFTARPLIRSCCLEGGASRASRGESPARGWPPRPSLRSPCSPRVPAGPGKGAWSQPSERANINSLTPLSDPGILSPPLPWTGKLRHREVGTCLGHIAGKSMQPRAQMCRDSSRPTSDLGFGPGV